MHEHNLAITSHSGFHFYKSRKRYAVVIGILLLLYLIYQLLLAVQLEKNRTSKESKESKQDADVGNNVNVAAYIEAQCSDTTRFVHKQLLPTWERLAKTNRMKLLVVPFGKARCQPHGDDYQCECQHGQSECELNQLMNCVIKHVDDIFIYMPVISCIQGKRSIEQAQEKCLAKLQFPVKRLIQCATELEGRKLLAEAGDLTAQLDPPLNFVPWIMIDGERSVDAFYDLTENVCAKLIPKPEECKV